MKFLGDSMGYLTPSYDIKLVLSSLLIASFASYLALDLVKRMHATDLRAARGWWIAGSLSMGTGIWSTHFVGMLAFSLPIALGFTVLLTLLSWIAAAGASGLALWLASRGRLTPLHLGSGALLIGAGICVMHYTGMAALDMTPPIVWRWDLVAASAAIAVGASGATLMIFFRLRLVSASRGLFHQLVASLIMGLAISGMHYTGMHAANFPFDSVCLSADILNGADLGKLAMLISVAFLVMTLFTSTMETGIKLASSLKRSNEELQLANTELQKHALLDGLTGLPNRLLFDDRLQRALAHLRRSDEKAYVAVLVVDLDDFKPINDSLGHAAGDLVLKEVGVRLCNVAREGDTVARIGSDEFVLLMEHFFDVADSSALAQRIVLALAQPMQLAKQQVHVTSSVGVAHYPAHGPGDKLTTHADAAMHAAKLAGGNTYAVFEPHMAAGGAQQLSLKFDLSRAVADQQLSLVYQPKVDARNGQLCGAESLLRWHHPELGDIGPSVFIPIAERYGLIHELGQWVIDEACRQMQAWDEMGFITCVAINLSVHQLRRDELPERIEQALIRHHVDPSRLLCEITESEAMEDIKAMQRACNGLRRIGVFLSIDDFGTGHSSLSYLRQLPVRQLKIDRSFVNDLETSDDARAVVDAVIKLAHALSLNVVAEGVETTGQLEILRMQGCDELQGYFVARPMAGDALLSWATARTIGLAQAPSSRPVGVTASV